MGKKPGGGCALYIKDNVTFHTKPKLIPPDMEGICGFVTFPNKHKIMVANIYRPPNVKVNLFERMDNLLNNFSNTKLEYILNGDLTCDLFKNPMDNHTKHVMYTNVNKVINLLKPLTNQQE